MNKKNLRSCAIALLLGLGSCLFESAWARCDLISPGLSFPIDQRLNGPHSIAELDAGAPLGSVLKEVYVHETQSYEMECLPSIGSRYFSILGGPAGHGAVLSGIPGIGLKLIGPDGIPMPYDDLFPRPELFNVPASYKLQLIKVGEMTQDGVLPEFLFESHVPLHGNLLIAKGRLIDPIEVSVRRIPTCLLLQQNVEVSFPQSNLDASTGPVLQATDFSIGLQCDGGTAGARAPLFVTFTDAVAPGNLSDVLTLSPISTAAGVGIRVLFKGTPVRFSPYGASTERMRVGSAGNGIHPIELVAELVRTGAVKTGHFSASSIFTIDYQ